MSRHFRASVTSEPLGTPRGPDSSPGGPAPRSSRASGPGVEALFGFRRLPEFPVIALIAANVFPLAGAFVFDWDAGQIVLLYWAENIIVGFYNVLRMFAAKAKHPVEYVGRLLASLFFCFHYGFFCAGHGLFVLALGGMGKDGGSVLRKLDWPLPLVIVQIICRVIAHAWRAMPPELFWPLGGLAVSHGISFIHNFIIRGERNRATVDMLMGQPYARIFVLHVAILAGAVPVMLLGSPVWLLAVLVVLKIGLDVTLHVRSHRAKDEKAEEAEDARPSEA